MPEPTCSFLTRGSLGVSASARILAKTMLIFVYQAGLMFLSQSRVEGMRSDSIWHPFRP
jgi:hypothetical protein